jgi:predicted Zn-dependent protease
LRSTAANKLIGLIVICLVLLALYRGCSSNTSSTPASPARPAFAAPSYENLPAEPRDGLRKAWEAAVQKPDDAPTVGRFGMMLLAYDQPQAAVAPLQRALELQDENFAWIYYLGQAQAAAGRSTEALDTFKKGLARRPTFVPLQLRTADALLAVGRLADAEHACLTILLAHPDAAPAHRTLSQVYEKAGRIAQAEQERTLAASAATNADATKSLATDLGGGVPPYMQDPWADALREWKPQALKNPASMTRQIHFEKGRDFLAKKQYKQAIEELTQTLTPEDSEAAGYFLTISIAYAQSGDRAKALESAEKAKKLATDLSQAGLLPAIDEQLAKLAAEDSAQSAAGEPGPKPQRP